VIEFLAIIGGISIIYWIARFGTLSALNLHVRRQRIAEWYYNLGEIRSTIHKKISSLPDEDIGYLEALPLLDDYDFNHIFKKYGDTNSSTEDNNIRQNKLRKILNSLTLHEIDGFSEVIERKIVEIEKHAPQRRVCGLMILFLVSQVEFMKRHAQTKTQRIQADKLIVYSLRLVCGMPHT
jgi:hypothetical protein